MKPSERSLKGIFNGEDAQKGYALNKMCHSLNEAANRDEFLADQEAYCRKFGLNEQQMAAVRSLKRDDLLLAGASMYFGVKLTRTVNGRSPAPRAATASKGH